MAKVNVSIPQGTRDFGPDVVRKRNYIFNTIRSVFELYGFEPLETPAMENIETLMGKYGEEGDKLIFRILDSGNPFSVDFFKGLQQVIKDYSDFTKESTKDIDNFEDPWSSPFWKLNPDVLEFLSESLLKNEKWKNQYLPNLKNGISDKALKYDLTIPFARYVALNHNKLTFPFKRYQIQPVWRADKPQRGRYREFYQCDADIVGSRSLLNEVELINIYFTVFEKLNIDCVIKINNRKVLTGITELIGKPITTKVFASIIDKLDKVGIEKIKQEFLQYGLTEKDWTAIENFLSLAEKTPSAHYLADLNLNSEIGRIGVDEVSYVITHLSDEQKSKIIFDSTLARGLDYYTGCIFEVKANGVKMGSIGGGGRYDDLTGLFGVPNIPGVGISFGVDRIYDVMEESKVFPDEVHAGTQVLFFNLGEEESKVAFNLMQQLRNKNVRCELYHEPAKFDKQFKYAEKKNIPFVIIMGSKELEEKTCVIKDIRKGEQQAIPVSQLGEFSFL